MSLFVAGFFSLSVLPMGNLLVPLWANEIGASPLMIGVAIGARSVLPVLFAIHGGALMDRLGAGRVILAFGVLAACLAPLYPLLPFVTAIVVIQLIAGFAQSVGWIGAQTQIGRYSGGDRRSIGRFTFVSTAGNAVAPLGAGIAWDAFGPWGAFGMMGLWSLALAVSVAITPALPGEQSRPKTEVRARDLLPQLRDYGEALRMWAVPIVAIVMTASMLMSVVYAMRNSFYPIYLSDISLSKTMIGVLITTGTLTSALAGLMVNRAASIVAPLWLLIFSVAGASIAIALTPFTSTLYWLFVLAVAFGLLVGFGFPVILSELAREVDVSQQGVSVGLRTTLNRLAALVAPVVMGAVVQWVDLRTGFVAIAATNLVLLTLLAMRLRARRHTSG